MYIHVPFSVLCLFCQIYLIWSIILAVMVEIEMECNDIIWCPAVVDLQAYSASWLQLKVTSVYASLLSETCSLSAIGHLILLCLRCQLLLEPLCFWLSVRVCLLKVSEKNMINKTFWRIPPNLRFWCTGDKYELIRFRGQKVKGLSTTTANMANKGACLCIGSFPSISIKFVLLIW